jgi:hypothetical protein
LRNKRDVPQLGMEVSVRFERISIREEVGKLWMVCINISRENFSVTHFIDKPWTEEYSRWMNFFEGERGNCKNISRYGDRWTIGIETDLGLTTIIHFTSENLAKRLRKIIRKARKEGFTFAD